MDESDRRIFAIKPFNFVKIDPQNLRNPQSPAKLPRPRSGHRIICDDDHNIFSFGGFNPTHPAASEGTADESGWHTDKPLFRDLWKFDNVTRCWHKVKTTGTHPQQLASHSAAYFRDHLIVYGGTGVPFGASSTNKIHSCNLKTGEWEYLCPQNADDSQIPSDQYGQAVVVDNESCCLYAIGGTTGFRYTIDVYKFNLFTRRWTLLWKRSDSDYNQFPEERYRHEIILHKNQIFVFGGGTASNCYGFKYIPVFDLKTKSWIKLRSNPQNLNAPIPAARKCHGCVKTSSSQVCVMGGSDGALIFKDIWMFDLESSAWTRMTVEMPIPLYFHGMTISPVGKVTIFGGVHRIMESQMDTNVRTNELHEVWLENAPLEELAWNAFVSYCNLRTLSTCTRLQLAELGVPTKFINRLNFGQLSALKSVKSVSSDEVSVPEPS